MVMVKRILEAIRASSKKGITNANRIREALDGENRETFHALEDYRNLRLPHAQSHVALSTKADYKSQLKKVFEHKK